MRSVFTEAKGNKTVFSVWAPLKDKMQLHLVHPKEQLLDMTKDKEGYWNVEVDDLPAHACYFFRPDGENDYPDPASQYQPDGVHGPSQVVDHTTHLWQDNEWKNIPLEEMILYELHVGSFTPEGTFEAIIPRLDELKATGINALELMPVAQFPGSRNWGYDAVYPYAVQNSYGGPAGLKKLVDACHQKEMAVLLDVVYNHVGPEGNYLGQYGPYFTDTYCTPWGDALNFDGAWSDGVRDYFSDNALYWFEYFHIDGLRCDAIHTVFDSGAVHFWEYTNHKVKELEKRLNRPFHLLAESDLNSPRVVKGPEEGGYGFSAQWLDDFHHALYTLIDPKGKKRYYDFGRMEQLAKAYREGFVHSGEWVEFRKRRYGASSAGVPGNKFIVFNMNHDQVGNRVGGERLCMLVGWEEVKLAAAAIMLSPYIPMLFMGEEYGDDTPFYYFISHSDPQLVEAVRKGRAEEFKAFGFESGATDPQSEKTFQASKLHWQKRYQQPYVKILHWHQELIGLRKALPALQNFQKKDTEVHVIDQKGYILLRKTPQKEEFLLAIFNLSGQAFSYALPEWIRQGQKVLDSKEGRWSTEAQVQIALLPGHIHPQQTLQVPPLSVTVYDCR